MGSTRSKPPRWEDGGGGKVFFCCDLDCLRAVPLERLEDDEAGLRAFAMGRMLAEQHSGVNGCKQRRFGRAGGVRRYRTEAWAENRTWSSGRNRGHCRCGTSKVTRGAGRLACLRRVCYKFVAEFGLTTTCRSSSFLRAKLTASSCITVQVWAEKPRTCNGFTTTRGKTRRGKWCLWQRRRTARC